MRKNYRFFKSTAAERKLESKNGFFWATLIVGAIDTFERKKIPDDKKVDAIKDIINTDDIQIFLYNKGLNHIRERFRQQYSIKLNKNKCFKYFFKKRGYSYFTDTNMVDFCRVLLQELNESSEGKIAFLETINENCVDLINMRRNHIIINDCVRHLFGFQKHIISNIIQDKVGASVKISNKMEALKVIITEMESLIRDYSFPNYCN